jgi:hypothetical protein
MMPDPFANHPTTLGSPAQTAIVITPSDTIPLTDAVRSVYVGSAGNLRVRMVSGAIVTFTAVLAGTIYPLRIDQVFVTGTTAGGLIGLR